VKKREREKTIMNMRREMGLTAKQIVKVQRLHVQYVQSVIDKFEKKAKPFQRIAYKKAVPKSIETAFSRSKQCF
jgi:hypothetical protein